MLQALKQFYERNARLAPRVPSGTSPEFTHLLHHLLKRDAKDRISFEDFISHPFLAPPTPPVHQKEATKAAAAKAVPERARMEGGREEGCLPPSPAVTQVLLHKFSNESSSYFIFQGVIPSTPPKQEDERKREDEARMETSDVAQQQQPKKQNSPSSSPEAAEAGFVMVPPSLAGDSSKHKTNQVTREE